jgi:hypothetical protein
VTLALADSGAANPVAMDIAEVQLLQPVPSSMLVRCLLEHDATTAAAAASVVGSVLRLSAESGRELFPELPRAMARHAPDPAQMWQESAQPRMWQRRAQSRLQMWAGRAQSWLQMWAGMSPVSAADVAGASRVPGADVAGASRVPGADVAATSRVPA